jgi:hypothetical protein
MKRFMSELVALRISGSWRMLLVLSSQDHRPLTEIAIPGTERTSFSRQVQPLLDLLLHLLEDFDLIDVK